MTHKHATEPPSELLLYVTATCLREFAPFIHVDYPSKAWIIILAAQTQTSNLFSLNLLITDFIFSLGIYNIFKDTSSSLTCIPWHSVVAEGMP